MKLAFPSTCSPTFWTPSALLPRTQTDDLSTSIARTSYILTLSMSNVLFWFLSGLNTDNGVQLSSQPSTACATTSWREHLQLRINFHYYWFMFVPCPIGESSRNYRSYSTSGPNTIRPLILLTHSTTWAMMKAHCSVLHR